VAAVPNLASAAGWLVKVLYSKSEAKENNFYILMIFIITMVAFMLKQHFDITADGGEVN